MIAAAALAVVVVLVLVTRGTAPPADHAAGLAPADAHLYVHLSTDPDRDQDRRLLATLRRLPAFARFDATLRGAKAWLGDEAALVTTAQGTAELLAVKPHAHAPGPVTGGFYVTGSEALVQRIRHGAPSLAALPAYKRAARKWPADRALEAWVKTPLGSPLAATASPIDGGIRVQARLLGARLAPSFAPHLLRAVPGDAFAFADIQSLRPAAPFLPAAAQPLVRALVGEVALSAAPGRTVTLVARVADPGAVRSALADLQPVVASALSGPGQLPEFTERDLGHGIDGFALTLAAGSRIVYAVHGERVAVSTTDAGVRRALRDADGLDHATTFNRVVTGVPDSAQALAFVAANQLLELADEAGLGAAAAYRAVRPDLARIRALGAVVRRQGNDTTAELNLLIP